MPKKECRLQRGGRDRELFDVRMASIGTGERGDGVDRRHT